MLGPDQGDYATALAACSAACDQRDTCLGIQLEFTSDVAGSLTLGGAPTAAAYYKCYMVATHTETIGPRHTYSFVRDCGIVPTCNGVDDQDVCPYRAAFCHT